MGSEATIRPALDRADYGACIELQRAVWGLDDLEITSVIQLIATVHAGGVLLVAEVDGVRIVGFAYALAAIRGGVPHLHSDMLAVLPEYRARGLGTRLKWAQREEALRRGHRLVTWTFDPMQARNARLNLHRLGAAARELLPDFYGATTSALHHGLPTDRLLVRWNIDSARVRERATGGHRVGPVESPALPRINDVTWPGGLPLSSVPALDRDEPELLLEIPADWDGLCRASAPLARTWQAAARDAFVAYFGRGYVAVDLLIAEEGGKRVPLYLLQKAP
jgi:predicted GNAT superfamily acetyltransferase